jgi:hypothetical protein
MALRPRPSRWQKWLRLNRLIPLLTLLSAGIAIVFSTIGLLSLTLAEQIIIALLALLAVDALNERVTILETVEQRLTSLATTRLLRTRAEMMSPLQQASQAKEICLLAIHGTSAITPYVGFYLQKLREGCRIRVILLHPQSPATPLRDKLVNHTQTTKYIETSLEALRGLLTTKTRGRCEVRLSQVFLPFSMFGTDLAQETGQLVVEFSSYRVAIDERPHIYLTAHEEPMWFTYYRQQFERVWADATVWSPDNPSV